MSRPNFFCNTNTLKYLAQMEYSDDHEAIDISVDCIELPFWLLFSSDEENYYLKLIKRYEIFWHDENKIKRRYYHENQNRLCNQLEQQQLCC